MKTSVVMTVYNGSRYLLEMLDSLRNQTRAIDEVLFFDDRSTDSSREIIQTYISEHKLSNWKLIINENNKGWEKNFTNGISAATGDIIFPCDQDDVWHKNKVSVCSSYLDKYMLIQHDQTLIGNSYGYPLHVKSIHKLFFLNLFDLPFKGCCMAFRRELLQKVLPIPKLVIVHDAWIGCWGYLSGSYVSINDELIDYRVHGKNVSVGTRNRLYYKILYRLQICYCLFKRSFF